MVPSDGLYIHLGINLHDHDESKVWNLLRIGLKTEKNHPMNQQRLGLGCCWTWRFKVPKVFLFEDDGAKLVCHCLWHQGRCCWEQWCLASYLQGWWSIRWMLQTRGQPRCRKTQSRRIGIHQGSYRLFGGGSRVLGESGNPLVLTIGMRWVYHRALTQLGTVQGPSWSNLACSDPVFRWRIVGQFLAEMDVSIGTFGRMKTSRWGSGCIWNMPNIPGWLYGVLGVVWSLFLDPNNISNMVSMAEFRLANNLHQGEGECWKGWAFCLDTCGQHSIRNGLLEHGNAETDECG